MIRCQWTPETLKSSYRQTDAALCANHQIAVVADSSGDDGFTLNPQTLGPDEDELVLAALRKVLTTEPANA